MHKSTQEYIDARKASLFPDADTIMAITCCRYLSLVAVSTNSPNSADAPLPFTQYAKNYWAYHTHKAETQRQNGRPEAELSSNSPSDIMPSTASSIEAASNLGLIQMVRELPDIKSKLIEACRHGNCGMVDLILRVHNYDLNSAPNYLGAPSIDKGPMPANDWKRSYRVDLKLYDNVEDVVLLTIATASGDIPMIELLLASGANPNIMSPGGKTALCIAAEKNFPEAVSLLLSHDTINPDSVGKVHPLTALSVAAKLGHLESLRLLAERSSLNFCDPTGRTALFFATEGGHVDCIAELLKQLTNNGLDVDYGGPRNYTPLMAVIAKGDIDATKVLLSRADITKQHGPTGYYPIHFEVTLPSPAPIPVLLAVDGIEPNVLDEKGRSAFRLAAELGHSEVMEELGKDPKVQLHLPCAEGRTAYDMIIRPPIGDEGVFRAMLSLDPVHVHADVTSPELSLLHRACSVLPIMNLEHGNVGAWDFEELRSEEADVAGLVTAMLDLPTIDVNLRDREGNTPLTLAIRSCQVDTVRALLQHKDILPNIGFEARNSSDPTMERASPLLMASSLFNVLSIPKPHCCVTISTVTVEEKYYRFRSKILNLLLDCPKVFTGYTNSKGWTALHVAAAHGNGDMIRSILDKTSLSTHLGKLLPDGQSILSLAMGNKMVGDETLGLLFANTPRRLRPDKEKDLQKDLQKKFKDFEKGPLTMYLRTIILQKMKWTGGSVASMT